MNLEDRIRNAIDRETEASAEPGVPEGLIRRARRRIALTVTVTTLGVVAVAGGGFAAARSLQSAPAPVPLGPPTTLGPSPIGTPPVSPSPSPLEGIPSLVDEFLRARKAGSGAEAFLSESGAQHYASSSASPALYGDDSKETRFGEHSIDLVERLADGRTRVLVRIQMIYLGDSPVCPMTEQLIVGAGRQAESGATQDDLILGASLYAAGWEEGELSELAAEEFVCFFVGSRLEGPEPEHFSASAGELLSANARRQYEAGEGGLELYPTSPQAGFWWIIDSTTTDEGVYLTVTLNNTGQPDAIYEYLLVGSDGSDGPPRILSAERIPCDEEHPCGSG